MAMRVPWLQLNDAETSMARLHILKVTKGPTLYAAGAPGVSAGSRRPCPPPFVSGSKAQGLIYKPVQEVTLRSSLRWLPSGRRAVARSFPQVLPLGLAPLSLCVGSCSPEPLFRESDGSVAGGPPLTHRIDTAMSC